jgi:NAD(P)-dependent dehydrogenase (short-subunit alcohol dehydrogenase family)
MEDVLLSGKHFVVTGGTQGLGRGIALHLARQGAAGIVICGRNQENGRAAAREISEAGASCIYVRADLAVEADCRTVVQTAEEQFGRVDGLVNAAGLTNRGTLEDTTVELWDLLFNVNVRAPFILTQETVRIMKNKGIPGSIVNIISDCAHGGYSYLTAYSASKGALATFTKNAAHTLRFDRIRVNGICIGWMYTPHEHLAQVEQEGKPENWLELVEKDKPFGRILRPQDVACLAVYLLSDQSEMMTGSLIDFDQKVIGGLD